MTHRFADLTFTDNVMAMQDQYGSRAGNKRLQSNFGPNDRLTSRESEFIQARDSFYIATVNEMGWPYVQHRGGPAGFLKVLSPNKIAYADFRGNSQLITTGNALANDRCSIILMDYPQQRRLKLLGHLHISDNRASVDDVLAAVTSSTYKARVERLAIIEVVAYDWNCPQHITPRYTATEYAESVDIPDA